MCGEDRWYTTYRSPALAVSVMASWGLWYYCGPSGIAGAVYSAADEWLVHLLSTGGWDIN